MSALATHPATTPEVIAEIAAGDGISCAQAAKRIPSYRAGRPCNPSTIFRWAACGIKLPDGRKIHLEAARLNGRWITTQAAIERFLSAQAPTARTASATPCKPARRGKQQAGIAAELDRIGIF